MAMAPTDETIPEDVTPAPRTEPNPRREANMKKMSTFNGVMFAAMADELAAMPKEKVAINLAPVGQFLGNMAGRAAAAAPGAMGALEGLGARALTGATNFAAQHGGQLGQQLGGHLMQAGQAVGGGQNLSRLAGAGIAGAGALGLGAAGVGAARAMAPRQPTITIQR